MMPSRANRAQMVLLLVLMVLLQFYVRPRLWGPRISPDFVFLGLMLFALRSSPGVAAVAGFVVGLAGDALTPARFGAGMMANTLVAYFSSWARAVFFADNLLVNAAFVGAGLWVRDLLILLLSGAGDRPFLAQLTIYSPLQALATSAFALLVLLASRQWLSIRLDG
jgi:rod shape-determining protein MreD